MIDCVKRWTSAAVAVFIATGVAACGSVDDSSTKAGGASLPVTLRLGYVDPSGGNGSDHIEDFVQRVEDLTDGALRIEPVWSAGGPDGTDDIEQVVARRVIKGDLDMAVVAARAWDTEGVTSLRALNAPMLVTSDEAVKRIISGTLSEELLAGLDKVGITGLGLLPASMRRLFVFGDRVDSLADWGGGLIRSLRSDTVYAVLATLNAKADDVGNDNDRTAAGIADGSLLGAESSFTDALRMPKLPSAVSNVTLFPKVEALVVKSSVFEQLSKSQREQLREAASQTVVDAVADFTSDTAAAEEFCSRGGSMLTASASDIEQIRQGFDSVYSWLEQDPSTEALIEKIAKAVGDIPAPPTPSCPDRELSPTPTSIVTSTGAFPEGPYRMEIPESVLINAGIDRQTAFEHAGTWMMSFDNGVLTMSDVGPGRAQSGGTGVYCVADGRISLGLDDRSDMGGECGDFWSAAWIESGDQVRFVDIRTPEGPDPFLEVLFGSEPFTKVG